MELGGPARAILHELAICARWIAGGLFAGMVVATVAKFMLGTDYDARDLGTAVWVGVAGYGLLLRPALEHWRRGR